MGLLVLLGTASYIVHSVNQTIRDSYAVWWVADMVIEHLHANNDAWPTSWDDLRDDYQTCVNRSGQPWQFAELRTRVAVDFAVDSQQLNDRIRQQEQPDFRVIWLQDGSDVHWQSREPNTMIFDYFKGNVAPQPVLTGAGGSSRG